MKKLMMGVTAVVVCAGCSSDPESTAILLKQLSCCLISVVCSWTARESVPPLH